MSKKTHESDGTEYDPLTADPGAAPQDGALPGTPEQKEVILPAGPHSETVKAIITELKADGRPSAVNCLYHLQQAVAQLEYHEGQPPKEELLAADATNAVPEGCKS